MKLVEELVPNSEPILDFRKMLWIQEPWNV